MGSFWVDGAVSAIKVLAFVCDVITYPVYMLIYRPWEKKAASDRIKAKAIAVEDKSITYRYVRKRTLMVGLGYIVLYVNFTLVKNQKHCLYD